MTVPVVVGAYYRDGAGTLMGPMSHINNIRTPGHDFRCDRSGATYTASGQYLPSGPSDRDLVTRCMPNGDPYGVAVGSTAPVTAGGSLTYIQHPDGSVDVVDTRTGVVVGKMPIPSGGPATAHVITARTTPPLKDIGTIVDQALRAQAEREGAQLTRQRALPTPEERLDEYKRGVAKLWEKGGLY